MKSKRLPILWLMIGAFLLVATVAIAAERLTAVAEPEDVDVSVRKSAANTDESEQAPFTAEELQEAREAAAREQVLRDIHGPQAMYQDASEGAGPTSLPSAMASGVDIATMQLLTRSDRVLVSTEEIQEGATRMESALFSDGTGIVELIWQVWPANVDLQSVLPQGTAVEYDGNLDITLRYDSHDNTIEVGVFDGIVYARAYTTLTGDMTIDTMRTLAMRLYKAVAVTD
ncbi:MAG: hypothetical protein ACE5F5_08945 [Acidimicrobiia bacterium]